MSTVLRRLVALGCLLLPVSRLVAEEAVRVSPPGSRPFHGSSPSYALNLNGRSLFVLTSDPLQRSSLYSSDGTPEGTQLLIPDGVTFGAHASPRFSVAVRDGVAYFGGPAGALWRSDGTPEGTALSVPSQGWIAIPMVAAANGRIWFIATTPSYSFQLWVSDGTAAETHFVSTVGMSPMHLLAVGDQAFYTGFTPQDGFRLMRSDGTQAGTYPVAVNGAGGMSYDAYAPHEIGGLVYFSGWSAGSGTEPWVTDGTPQGTRMIAELAAAGAGSEPFGFSSALGKVLFATDVFRNLWTTDGTPSGTYPIMALPTTVSYLHSAGSFIYFEGASDQGAWSLWRSDGSASGTFALVENLGQGVLPYMSGDAGGRLVFAACEPATGCEPWITDGTAQGTRLLADVVPGPQSSNPVQFALAGGFVFFAAADGEWSVALPAGRTPDFDRNGYADLCWQGVHERLSLWLMRGVEALEMPAVLPETPPAGASLAGCGDLTGDGTADLIFRDVAGGALEVWRMQGSHRQDAQVLTYRADKSWTLVGVGDLDADGHNDLLWHSATTGALSAWLMNGLERRSVAALDPSGIDDVRWRPAGLGDFDADGKSDILWKHQGTGRLVVWLMDGLVRRTGLFLKPSQAVSLDWHVRSVIDLDSDGDADIVWRHGTTGRLVAWLMDGTVRVDGRVLSPPLAP